MAAITIKVIALLILLQPPFGFGGDHSHYIYTFPDGYVGWVRMTIQVPGAKHYRWMDHDKNIRIDFNNKGIFTTSDVHIVFTDDKPQFFYVSRTPDGKERLVPLPKDYIDQKDEIFGGLVYSYNGEFPTWMFFVGPPDMRAKYAWHGPARGENIPMGKQWGPSPGRVTN